MHIIHEFILFNKTWYLLSSNLNYQYYLEFLAFYFEKDEKMILIKLIAYLDILKSYCKIILILRANLQFFINFLNFKENVKLWSNSNFSSVFDHFFVHDGLPNVYLILAFSTRKPLIFGPFRCIFSTVALDLLKSFRKPDFAWITSIFWLYWIIIVDSYTYYIYSK